MAMTSILKSKELNGENSENRKAKRLENLKTNTQNLCLTTYNM